MNKLYPNLRVWQRTIAFALTRLLLFAMRCKRAPHFITHTNAVYSICKLQNNLEIYFSIFIEDMFVNYLRQTDVK